MIQDRSTHLPGQPHQPPGFRRLPLIVIHDRENPLARAVGVDDQGFLYPAELLDRSPLQFSLEPSSVMSEIAIGVLGDGQRGDSARASLRIRRVVKKCLQADASVPPLWEIRIRGVARIEI